MLCLAVLSVQSWAQSPAGTPPAPVTPTTKPATTDDLRELRDRIVKQEEAIKQLQQSLEQQQILLDQKLKEAETTGKQQQHDAQNGPASTTPQSTLEGPAKMVPVVNVARAANNRYQHPQTAPESPLGISIGNTTFTPLGFVDATFFARSTNVGSGIGTNFAGVPFNNAAAGHLSETNFSAQNSRIGMRVDSNFLNWKVLGYLEADFLFNNDANSFQIGSNSAGLRLRNYFVDANNGKLEFLAGQDWSFMTPNRKGLSPLPSDIFYTQNEDTNYQIGLVWTRAPQFRFIAHPNKTVALGVAVENPQQYIGGGNGSGAVTLPSGLSSIQGQFQYSPGLNVANSITNVPNLMPDIQAKLALDGTPGGRAMHVEVAGMVRGFKDYILPSVGNGTVAGSHTAVGGAGEVNSNLELFKNFKLIENLYFSDGGGRYVFGSAPDLALRPDGSLSLIHTDSTVDGFEYQLKPNTLLGLYYGGVYVGRDVTFDPRAVRSGGTAAATPLYVGYGYSGYTGYAGPSATQNKYIQEITFDWVQTLWKNRNYGALAFINQYSYVFREPWAEPAGTPKQAHSSLIYVNLRYTLP